MIEYVIDELTENQRFDKFLQRKYKQTARAFLYRCMREKKIRLNGKKAAGNEILKSGDVVAVYVSLPLEEASAIAETLPIDAVFEDENILIANKPRGLLTQPDTPNGDSLSERAKAYANADFTPVCANRLDRNTTGLVLIAKNLPAAQALSLMLKERTIGKYYLAIVHGEIREAFTIDKSLSKDAKQNKAFADENGKASVTEVTPISSNGKYSLVEIKLQTGRTHQIRAHLSGAGFPIVGDAKYGAKDSCKYQLLHCHKVVFNEPGGFLGYLCGKTAECPAPADFYEVLSLK
ncbi:pseudouridine synthase [Clostridia bacterium]|nr:pseudouridine synthase [Clostridia bacterium]GHV39694.1 pseudouridine synthase [Clostridia bacterium]